LQNQRVVVEVIFKIEKDAEGFPKSRDEEALLCEPLSADCSKCRIASVPFYLNSVAYGDEIATAVDEAGNLIFDRVISRSGYSVFRIWLNETEEPERVVKELLPKEVLLEREGRLVAIAVSQGAVDQIVDFLLDGKAKGRWGAQDGYVNE
jgi:hypothetical protein